MSVVVRYPWTRQPQGVVRVDYSGPLTKSIAFATIQEVEVSTGVLATQKAVIKKPGTAGVGSRATARAVGNGLDFGRGTWGASSSAAVTLVIVADPQVPGSGDAADVLVSLQPFANRGSASNALFVGIQPTTNRFYVEHFVSGSINRTAYASGYTGTGAAVYVVTFSQGTITIYRNSVDVTTARPNTTWVSDSALGDSLTVHNVGAWVYNNLTTPVYMTAGFKRVLSQAEIVDVSRNPWQIFAPVRRSLTIDTVTAGNSIAVPAGAISIAGFAPTVSNPNALGIPSGALTLTIYAPTVTSPQSVAVPAASLGMTGFAPTVSNPQAVSIPAGSLVLTGIAPSITNPKSIAMPVGSIRLNGFAPTVTDGTVVPSTIRYDITTGRLVKTIGLSLVIGL